MSLEEAVERLKFWNIDSGLSAKDFAEFQQRVELRLRRTKLDEPIDNRSIESVAWMANELRARVHQHFLEKGTKVRVYRGAVTAWARKASGLEWQIEIFKDKGKHRLDRRHHVIDAATTALLSNMVATVLAERENARQTEQLLNKQTSEWKKYEGADDVHRIRFQRWKNRMGRLVELLNQAIEQDRIVVTSNLRLRLGNGQAHEAKIEKLDTVQVGDALSVAQIDRASSEALWCALTQHPDFDWKNGLPADPDRRIRVHSVEFEATDTINLFEVKAGSIAVRGGSAKLGSSFHHARIYRIHSKKEAFAMMRVYTVDLQRFRNEDLFNVELPPQTMSVRQCDMKLRQALREGTAEYVGWLVTDDELEIDMSAFTTGQVADALAVLGPITRWRVDGFESSSRLRLRPQYLSAEGIKDLKDSDVERVEKIIDDPGWRVAVNKLFVDGRPTVVRRDALGRARWRSKANLPVSWKA